MARVVSLKRNGAGWAVRLVRENNPDSRAMVERLGFVWRPDVGVLGAYATDDIAIASALLDLKQVCVNADRGVEAEIRSGMAAIISAMDDVTKTMVADTDISVTAAVAETSHVEMEAPALDPADAMKAIPVTETVTEMAVANDMVPATADETKFSVKRKRGRPPKLEGAMTAAERARRYRRKHTPSWKDRRVDLSSATVERAENLAAETGFSVDEVIYFALGNASPAFWKSMQAARIKLNKESEQRQEKIQAQADVS
ncbi:hypothetical protein [Agrobacterium pusense]|uniref:hypothetical protein n=1 Tax=Agrobacterium pusense TaxID=648995 RepID=UPI0013005738|nr:hypothetical protein [Agrobacterium pusense]